MIEVRKAIKGEAKKIIEVIKNNEKSGNILFTPAERASMAERFENFIETLNQQEKSRVFIAVEKEEVVGCLILQNDDLSHISHRAHLIVGIKSSDAGKGIGRALLSYGIDWAKQAGLHRLELTVVKENEAAVRLYQKMGFIIEGIKRDSLLINREYFDEYFMSKLL